MTIIAGSGHRPDRCEDEEVVRRKIYESLSGASVAICGMAAGYDLWFGTTALRMGLEVWAAKPWTTHGALQGDESLYAEVFEGASRVINVTEADEYPGPWAYHKRNEWMVDHADRLLLYWDGSPQGGTFACRNYAMKVGTPIRNIYA